jgi:hypothetical protein
MLDIWKQKIYRLFPFLSHGFFTSGKKKLKILVTTKKNADDCLEIKRMKRYRLWLFFDQIALN